LIYASMVGSSMMLRKDQNGTCSSMPLHSSKCSTPVVNSLKMKGNMVRMSAKLVSLTCPRIQI
jgi:hypothetical protein